MECRKSRSLNFPDRLVRTWGSRDDKPIANRAPPSDSNLLQKTTERSKHSSNFSDPQNSRFPPPLRASLERGFSNPLDVGATDPRYRRWAGCQWWGLSDASAGSSRTFATSQTGPGRNLEADQARFPRFPSPYCQFGHLGLRQRV